MLVFGTVGNLEVILIICKFKHMKKTAGNLFILNLAVCDLLTPMINISCDFYLVEGNCRWHLGPAMCSVTFSYIFHRHVVLSNSSCDLLGSLQNPATSIQKAFRCKKGENSDSLLPHVVTLELSPSGHCAEVSPNDLLPKIYTFFLFLGQYNRLKWYLVKTNVPGFNLSRNELFN